MKKIDTLFQSAGWQAMYKIGYYAEIFAIFIENYRDLIKTIDIIQSSKQPIIEHFTQNHLSRYIFNFLASATALKCNCYVLMQSYKDTELWEKYKAETSKYFLNNDLVAFINDFRNYQTHYKVELSFVSAQNKVVFLTYELLRHPKQWNNASKSFIQKSGEEIVVEDICKKYYKLNEEFSLWLINELRLLHKKDFEEIAKTAQAVNAELPKMYLDIVAKIQSSNIALV